MSKINFGVARHYSLGAAPVLHVKEPPDGEISVRSAILGQSADVWRRDGQEGVTALKVLSLGVVLAVGAAGELGGRAAAALGVGAVGRSPPIAAATELSVLAGATLLEKKTRSLESN